MAFMIPQVFEEDWLMVDGPMGGETVEVSVVGSEWAAGLVRDVEKCGDLLLEENSDFFENDRLFSAEVVHGWCGRFSAPGYMDWDMDWDGPYPTEEEAWVSLAEAYPDDFVPDYDAMTTAEKNPGKVRRP